ncbi:SRPBCC family protein [Jatrophihabitans sp. GAS493]|uniref:SRPBCC family protein n=1 Tax=Jatrophihabitans sp. GAS493 TaxID=1907575 RepID=UPI0012FE4674|nr:SRPBCC family protein [Jatrophihabitans sp. GAS493]
MNTFSATNESTAVVPAEREAIWGLLTDPAALTRLTPLLSRIDADGDHWTWHLQRIAALGVNISPTFTERMSFEPLSQIVYAHDPPAGVRERTGVAGRYDLHAVEGGTSLAIRITISIELPLPKAAGPAVTRVISSTMQRTGEKFAANLLRELAGNRAR